MIDWKTLIVRPAATVQQAVQVIDTGGVQFALVADDNGRLVGVVTDGDVRRAFLKGVALGSPITEIMNRTPKALPSNADHDTAIAMMRTHSLRHIPLLDSEGRIVGLEAMSDLVGSTWRDNPVVLMAGGLGQRLHPITIDTPKPLLHVGGQPILETIIRNFISQSFRQFYVSVNYKADQIKAYFGDGSQFGVNIRYIHEPEPLGTAGSLSLLTEFPQAPMLVMNSDILTNADFAKLLSFHEEQRSDATMCVRDFDFQVPYGVVDADGHRFLGVTEKPVQRFFVNAGIYVLGPAALAMLVRGEALNMTELFQRVRSNSARACIYPIRDYWLDIGRFEDFDRAKAEFTQIFK
jgi:dTDP-glucose pyrophosphorylase